MQRSSKKVTEEQMKNDLIEFFEKASARATIKVDKLNTRVDCEANRAGLLVATVAMVQALEEKEDMEGDELFSILRAAYELLKEVNGWKA